MFSKIILGIKCINVLTRSTHILYSTSMIIHTQRGNKVNKKNGVDCWLPGKRNNPLCNAQYRLCIQKYGRKKEEQKEDTVVWWMKNAHLWLQHNWTDANTRHSDYSFFDMCNKRVPCTML